MVEKSIAVKLHEELVEKISGHKAGDIFEAIACTFVSFARELSYEGKKLVCLDLIKVCCGIMTGELGKKESKK